LIKLKHIIHGAVVSEIEMTEGEFTIGRNHGNDLQLDGGGVSGEHAVITLVADSIFPEMFDVTIRDLNSTNGTYVNNTSVKQQKIENGDYIRFGNYEYKVFDDQSNFDGTQTEYHISEE
jgi:pSer/pThr/pTyr-binding forkhead associated (FHA) protein